MERTNKTGINDSKPQSRDEFQEIFNQSPIGILLYDKNGITVNANDSALKMLGFSRLNDVLGHSLFDNSRIAEKKDELRDKGIVQFQAPLDLEKIKDYNLYSNKNGFLFLDYTVSVTDSGYLVQINDITESKNAEQELKQSRRRKDDILDSVNESIISVDRNWNIIFVNDNPSLKSAAKAAGLKECKDLIGLNYWKDFPSLKETILEDNYRAAMKKRETRQFEYTSKYAPIWYDIRVYPTAEGITIFSKDITERKKAEEAVKESKEFAENLIETANVIVLGLDPEGKINIFNKAAEEITGYSREEALNNSYELVLPRDRYEYVWKEFDRLMEGGLPKNYENPILTKSGEERYITWQNNEVYKNGQIVGLISFGMDITDRKKAEEQIELERKRLETILETTPSGVIIVEASDGKISYINKRAKQLYGIDITTLDLAEAITKVKSRRADGSEYPVGEGPSGRALKGQVVHNEEMIIEQADGTVIPIFGSTAPIFNSEGELIAAVAIFDDITDRKKAEQEAELSRKRLQDVLSSIDDPIYSVDYDWNFIIVNNAPSLNKVAELIGLESSKDLVGMNLWEIYPHLQGTIVEDNFRGAMEKREIRSFENFSEGAGRWFNTSAYPSAEGITVITRDITERKKLEEEFKKSEARFRSVLDNSLDAVYRVNLKTGRYEYTSPAFEHVFGFSAEELMSQTPEQAMSLIHPDDIPLVKDTLSRLDETGNAKVDYRVRDNRGEYRWLSNHLSQIRDDAGKPMYRDGTVRNITQQKKDEEALKEAFNKSEIDRTRLNTLIKTIPSAIVIIEKPDGEISFINEHAKKLYGMDPTGLKMEEYPKIGLLELDGTPYLPEEMPASRSLLKGEIVRNEDLILENPDGKRVIVSASSAPIYDANGEISAVIGVFDDITERKKLEEALRKSRNNLELKVAERTAELKYQADLLLNVNDAIIATDQNYIITSWNPAAARLYGWSADEVIGKNSREILHTEFQGASNPEMVESIVKNGGFRGEIIQKHKDGNPIYLESVVMAIKDENDITIGHVAVNRDITERKEIEEALQESEERFRVAILNSPVNVSNQDLNLEYTWIYNPQLGYSPDEVVGNNDYDLLPPETAEHVIELKRRAIKNDTRVNEEVSVEFEGMTMYYDFVVEPLHDPEGEIIGVTNVVIDITKRKKAEKSLKELIDELERSNAELQQFAYVSSHDLQEPLRTIASFTQLLERRYKGQLDSDADEFMEYIVEAAKRMQQLINDLLEYSRVATSGEELKEVNTEKVLDNVLQNLKSSITENNAEITHDNLPTVIADKTQLNQVFQNLIGNAIKFKKDDEPPEIHVSARKDEEKGQYLFSVSDNGIGMEPQYAERIFVIFQRLHTREVYSGTGIGLSIVKRIIERHGGRVWMESSLGDGSTFYFTIPIIEAA